MSLAERVARGIWASDVKTGQMFTSWDDLGGAGQDAYLKDAKALIEVAPIVGLEITVKEKP